MPKKAACPMELRLQYPQLRFQQQPRPAHRNSCTKISWVYLLVTHMETMNRSATTTQRAFFRISTAAEF